LLAVGSAERFFESGGHPGWESGGVQVTELRGAAGPDAHLGGDEGLELVALAKQSDHLRGHRERILVGLARQHAIEEIRQGA
jgi:hypothetical protein